MATKIAFAPVRRQFGSLACKVWDDLGGRHSFNMHWDERGITDELVYQLLKRRSPHIQVFKAISEKTYGHDIDLFIEADEAKPDQYIWLCLQAKVMYEAPRAVYNAIDHEVTDPDDKTKQIYQWELLGRHPTDRIPFYLFYNGFTEANYRAAKGGSRGRIPRRFGCTALFLPHFWEKFISSPSYTLKGRKSDVNYKSVNESGAMDAFPWQDLFNIGRLEKLMKTRGLELMYHPAKDKVKVGKKDYRKIELVTHYLTADNDPDFSGVAPAHFQEEGEVYQPRYKVYIGRTEAERLKAKLRLLSEE
ncbi:DUF6615 family protein [Hymenobacter sp.]|jgi:hypothetical protein|uniref:DUF6615 family protein n=1 Tax=Hymenobacter sp. TaxID=1898978 RepID=UPI002EDA6AFB